MVFTIPEGLHADLNPLAWMVGTWRGKGRGEYPTIPAFEFAQEVVFNHDGRNFLNYFSRSWIIDAEGEIVRPAASCLLYTSPSPRDRTRSRMPSSA